jgi:hypothetical protein
MILYHKSTDNGRKVKFYNRGECQILQQDSKKMILQLKHYKIAVSIISLRLGEYKIKLDDGEWMKFEPVPCKKEVERRIDIRDGKRLAVPDEMKQLDNYEKTKRENALRGWATRRKKQNEKLSEPLLSTKNTESKSTKGVVRNKQKRIKKAVS